MTQLVSAERAAALRNKCLNLANTCRSGSGSASERTPQSRQLMSPVGAFRTWQVGLKMSVDEARADITVAQSEVCF